MKTKLINFTAEKFVKDVLKELDLEGVKNQVVDILIAEILMALNERIISTIIDALDENQLFRVKKLLADHPEIDEIEALVMICNENAEIAEKLKVAVGKLFFELVKLKSNEV